MKEEVAKAVEQVRRYGRFSPKSEVLGDLSLICERINFSKELKGAVCCADRNRQLDAAKFAFRDGVGLWARALLEDLGRLGLLATLATDEFQKSINEVDLGLDKRSEAVFFSSVELPEALKERISVGLKEAVKEDTRVVFAVDQDIVAGFVLRDGFDVVDRSYRANLVAKIKDYFLSRSKNKTFRQARL